MDFKNTYSDDDYAAAYAQMEFPGTYYLAFRDLPEILSRCRDGDRGGRALDFGCGTGRSARFLQKLGFDVVGIDIAEEMIRLARGFDSGGDYRLVDDGDLSQFADGEFDVILCAFPFDNIATAEKKTALFGELRRVVKPGGRIVSMVSSPEIYVNEWASMTTKDFPENKNARCGDVVKIIVTALNDTRPTHDIIWPDEDYRAVYEGAGLEVLEMHRPLGRDDEPYEWVSETTIAPWVIYVLGRAGLRPADVKVR